MVSTLYQLKAPRAPWGDYGRILAHGMAAHLPREGGLVQLERTGPFMPPMTFPGFSIVVKAWLRERLEHSGLTGFTFAPVIKRRIVRLDWHLWDRTADEPPEYPRDGEPENYILDREHSEPVSRMMADVFELVPQEIATIDRSDGFRVVRGSWGEADLFHGHGAWVKFASERAREWLMANVGEHVAFEPAQVA